jgi:hypothetical protein
MSIKVLRILFCNFVLIAGIAVAQQSSKLQSDSDIRTASLDINGVSSARTSVSCAAKKTGCCLDSSICSDKQYCDDNCQCTRKKPSALSQEADTQSAAIPSAKETRTDQPETTVSNAVAYGEKKFGFMVDKLDFTGLGVSRVYEDCGPDKGRCAADGHCCQIGGSGWCCPKDKGCGEEVGECK